MTVRIGSNFYFSIFYDRKVNLVGTYFVGSKVKKFTVIFKRVVKNKNK